MADSGEPIKLDVLPSNLKPILEDEATVSDVLAACERIRDFYSGIMAYKRWASFRKWVFLEKDVLVVAAASACVDMSRLEPFHEMDGGPSGYRRGAYLGFWVANKKPIQYRPFRARHPDMLTINEHLATVMALAEIDKADRLKKDAINKVYNTIHYGLTWERYSARELEDILQVFHDAIH